MVDNLPGPFISLFKSRTLEFSLVVGSSGRQSLYDIDQETGLQFKQVVFCT